MTDDSDWPLPSQPRRVRLLLYFAEGLIIGAGFILLLLAFFGAFVIDIETGSFNPEISGVEVVFLLIILVILLRAIAFFKSGSRHSREDSPEYRDWKESRRWMWVVAAALPLGGILLGTSLFLWGWWSVVFLQDANLLMLGTVLVGFILYMYVLQRIGVKII